MVGMQTAIPIGKRNTKVHVFQSLHATQNGHMPYADKHPHTHTRLSEIDRKVGSRKGRLHAMLKEGCQSEHRLCLMYGYIVNIKRIFQAKTSTTGKRENTEKQKYVLTFSKPDWGYRCTILTKTGTGLLCGFS